MIVLLRGASGSGKSFIAREAMARAGGMDKALKLPLGPYRKVGAYIWDKAKLTVIGRYDEATGGCDAQTWPGAPDEQEALITAEARRGQNVLFEGLLVGSWGKPRLKRLHAADGLTVILLATTIDECLASIYARREAAQSPNPFNEIHTRNKHRSLIVTTKNNRKIGLNALTLPRAEAMAKTMELLGL